MRVWKLVWNDAAIGIERDDAERMQELDSENPYFERVPGLGAFDEDRSGHRMRAWPPLRDLAAPRPSANPESRTRLAPANRTRCRPPATIVFDAERGRPEIIRSAGCRRGIVVTPSARARASRAEIVRARLLCPSSVR